MFTREPEGALPKFQQLTNKVINKLTITADMVQRQINKLDPNKFSPDEIHPKIFLELVKYVSEPLASLMNITLLEGKIPGD